MSRLRHDSQPNITGIFPRADERRQSAGKRLYWRFVTGFDGSAISCLKLGTDDDLSRENRREAIISEAVQIESKSTATCIPVPKAPKRSSVVFWLQGITLVWMLVECGIALYAAAAAQSPAMLAFGSDSLVELMSAAVVLL